MYFERKCQGIFNIFVLKRMKRIIATDSYPQCNPGVTGEIPRYMGAKGIYLGEIPRYMGAGDICLEEIPRYMVL